MSNNDLILRADVLDLAQSYGPATYDMPYGSGDMIIRPEDVMALPAVDAIPVEWLEDRIYDMERAPLYRRYAEMLLMEWLQEQKEQEART